MFSVMVVFKTDSLQLWFWQLKPIVDIPHKEKLMFNEPHRNYSEDSYVVFYAILGTQLDACIHLITWEKYYVRLTH
jgi:hypothetical protein